MSVTALAGPVAQRQHGAVHRRQLLEVGATREGIDWAVAAGELIRAAPAVYVVAGSPRTWKQRLMVAVLDAGPGTCVSHRSALVLLGLARRGAPEVVEISSPRSRSHRLGDVIVHRQLDHRPDEVVVIDGIPCTGPLRTLVDLGAVEPWWEVRDAVERALQSGHVTVRGCEWELSRLSRRGRAGCGVFRRVLDERALKAASPDRSLLEPRMAGIFRRFGLPTPAYQHVVEGVGRIDFAYRDLKIAIEVDGFEAHGTPAAMTADFERQHRLEMLGWRVIRFTWFQVIRRPHYVAQVIREVLGATSRALHV